MINQVPRVSVFAGGYIALYWQNCDLTQVHLSLPQTVPPRNDGGIGTYFLLNVMVHSFRKKKSLVSFVLGKTWFLKQNGHVFSRDGNGTIF